MASTEKQFVVVRHETQNGIHWDLMLEAGDVLWTWRLDTPPDRIAHTAACAERIFDHSLRFLTYEGPVQNNTGDVSIVDKGGFELTDQTEGSLQILLSGSILNGPFRLSKQSNSTAWKLQYLDAEN